MHPEHTEALLVGVAGEGPTLWCELFKMKSVQKTICIDFLSSEKEERKQVYGVCVCVCVCVSDGMRLGEEARGGENAAAVCPR